MCGAADRGVTDRAIRVEQMGRVTILTIDRQEVRNALDAVAQAELQQAFDAFAADDEQWVAILTGAGPLAFCAGHDLRTAPPRGPEEMPAGGFGGLTARFDLDKPVIAAVNGVAVGGGFELALACDIVIAARSASFALPEVKVGMAALGGGILRLSRQIGPQRAMGMMLTGRRVGAEEGLALGFVTELAEDDVLAAALRWADALLAVSPLAVRATKRIMLACADLPLDQAMQAQWALPEVARLQHSEDAVEGQSAFNARRPPRWTGR
jgi:crotonobetainyl-CoA hydratase